MLTRHELAADVGIEPTSYALTARCIALMLIRKNKWSGMRESNPLGVVETTSRSQ